MSTGTVTTTPAVSARRRHHGGIRKRDATAGWLFTAPVIIILGLFLFIPVLMALWVSVSDWTGRGGPLSGGVNFVGLDNYKALVAGGLTTSDFGIALKNNLWYVLLVVPLQTILALLLALLVNREGIKARGAFRTAYYFPSVTSTVAITVLWLFLFSTTGAINKVISFFGGRGPNWFNDPSAIFHFGATTGPAWLTSGGALGVTWWDWLGGPSVAMSAMMAMAIFTTSGTFMLLFLAALQNLSPDVDEAAEVDGATGLQRWWYVTLPQLRPTVFTVVTLGTIGCWQVFDQIYTATQGGPAKTTLTPAYLSYSASFGSQQWGVGAAIAFVLFFIIILFTLVPRWLLRERKPRQFRIRKATS